MLFRQANLARAGMEQPFRSNIGGASRRSRALQGQAPFWGMAETEGQGNAFQPLRLPPVEAEKREPAGGFKFCWTAHLKASGVRSTPLPADVQLEGESR